MNPGGTYKSVDNALCSNGKPVIMVSGDNKTIYQCTDESKLADISGKELSTIMGKFLYSESIKEPITPSFDKCVKWDYYQGFIIP